MVTMVTSTVLLYLHPNQSVTLLNVVDPDHIHEKIDNYSHCLARCNAFTIK